MDLFGDLPEPASMGGNTPVSSTQSSFQDGTISKPVIEKRKALDDNCSEIPAKRSNKGTEGCYDLYACYAERKGEREDMQDAHTLILDYLAQIQQPNSSINRVSYIAVFDGHGGVRASKYAADNLHKTLAKKFPKGDKPMSQIEKDMKKSFVETFKQTDEAFLKISKQNKPSWKDGSTAVCMLAINNCLYVANLGDSKAVLCRFSEPLGQCVAIALTKDHSPSIYEERIRIQKAGGQVREGRVMGVLEVSRSLGDGPYKRHGVTCVPDVKRCQLTENDKFVLLACDGLWKIFNNESAIAFVNKVLEDETIKGTETKTAREVRYDTACTRLANEAVRRLSSDNVTVILVAIDTS